MTTSAMGGGVEIWLCQLAIGRGTEDSNNTVIKNICFQIAFLHSLDIYKCSIGLMITKKYQNIEIK